MFPRSSVEWRSGPWICAHKSPTRFFVRSDRGSSMRVLKEVRNLLGSYHVKSGIYHYYRNEFKQAVDFFRRALAGGSTLPESDRKPARFYLPETFLASAERLEGKGDLESAARDYARASE